MGFPKEKEVKMLDWDYRAFLKHPEKIKKKHLQLVKEHTFDVVMSMDLWSTNWEDALKYANELKKHASRVLIPVHYFVEELLDHEMALPNANWFGSNVFPPGEYRDKVTHLLGGSPQSQLKLMTNKKDKDLEGYSLRLKNIESVDGNQMFWCAVRHGKYWLPHKPFWFKPDKTIPNQEIFEMSLFSYNKILSKIET